jgi:hypothetical protein
MSSTDFLNKVTLDCLTNREYEKHLQEKTEKTINKKDKKFYKKRIYNLTKQLLTDNDTHKNIPTDVLYTFDNYINSCIHYFKSLDNNDILQKEYSSIDYDNIPIPNIQTDDHVQYEDADKLMMRSIKMPTNSLDHFVKKKVKKQNSYILPKQKNINLREPELKNKGIIKLKKKKNINNKYEKTDETK